MNILRRMALVMAFAAALLGQPALADAPNTNGQTSLASYVLGDSIAFGLHLDGIENKLQEKLGGVSRVSYDGGRSITTRGNQIGMNAFESIESDKEFIATAGVIIVVLGMNPQEDSFEVRQQQLMDRFMDIAPRAKYYWVDIGATAASHADVWNARNKVIHGNASRLGYSVVSRYRAIFGADADPLNIARGKNFPGWANEPGLAEPGNIHGYYPELTRAILSALSVPVAASSAKPPIESHLKKTTLSSYILGDSIAYGLHLDGLETKLKERLGGDTHINYDGGRSITTPGGQTHKSALESIDIDKDLISKADVIILVLGMNPHEESFDDSQRVLIEKIRGLAPQARFYWVDIGATASTHTTIWNSRNKSIYENAKRLDYTVISRYRSIFGPSADPMNITAGLNFPGWENEPGLSGTGNIHGYYPELSRTIVKAVSAPAEKAARPKTVRTPCLREPALAAYVLGDSITFGLHKDRLALKMQTEFGGITRISYDTGRSITTAGSQIKKSALDSVDLDREFISRANLIIVSLGTNQNEESFQSAQKMLMNKLLALAPNAKYYWIDIGATMSTQTAGWNARNRVIYEQAESLGYSIISRYKAVFGPDADPQNISVGRNFPDMDSEPGYGGSGNIHGAYPALTEAILDTLARDRGCKTSD